jgi:DnaK suppressor protein
VAKAAKAAKTVKPTPAAAKVAKAVKPAPAAAKVAKVASAAAKAVPAAAKPGKSAPAMAKPAAKASGRSAGKARAGHGAPTTKHAASAGGASAAAKASVSSQTRVTKAPAPARKSPGSVARPGRARPGSRPGVKAGSSKRVGEGYAKDERFLAGQRTALLRERATYLDQAASLKAEAEALVEEMEPGDIQFDDESGEGGTVTVDRERDLALSAQAMAAVEEIDHTLVKMDNGTYGICENCGRSIVKARLEALPYARLCIDCKSGGLSRR